MDMSLEQAPDHYCKGNTDIMPRKLTLNSIFNGVGFCFRQCGGPRRFYRLAGISSNDTPFYDAKRLRTCNHDTGPIMGMQRVLGHECT